MLRYYLFLILNLRILVMAEVRACVYEYIFGLLYNLCRQFMLKYIRVKILCSGFACLFLCHVMENIVLKL